MSTLRRTLLLALAGAAAQAAAQGLPPGAEGSTAYHPLGGKGSAPKTGAGPRQITWEELVPKDWDPTEAFKNIDVSQLDDADPRAAELLMKMQEVLNNAPANPALNGQTVRLPGFVVPLEEKQGQLTEFLLVPYFGACIHTPPPPANQILHVRPKTPVKFRAMDTVWVAGRLSTSRNDSMMGASSYSMAADSVIKYTNTK